MNSISPSVEAVRWGSERECASVKFPGVRFRIARMSFGRRLDLARKVRELGQRMEFLEAGETVRERMEAAVLSNEIDRVYAEWGLVAVDGLLIDGDPATPLSAIERGPIELVEEIIAAVKRECGLADEERKN